MPYHAIEIILTRPVDEAELARAARVRPLAADATRIRLLVLIRAKTPARALKRLRRQLGDRLPIDCLTTCYPDARGRVVLNFTPAGRYAPGSSRRRSAPAKPPRSACSGC